jgi:hypothetical protein
MRRIDNRNLRPYMKHRQHRRQQGYKTIAENSIGVIGVLAIIIYRLVFRHRT